jgi:uncharacterized membrane protein YdjX (TVP38/TMEM64 family)
MSSSITAAPSAQKHGGPRPRLVLKLVVGAALLVLAVSLGRDFGHHLPEVERWIGSHGPAGRLVFAAAVVVLTSVFFPDTVFALIAGVLFGVVGGTVLVVIGSLIMAAVNFVMSRLFLRDTVRGWLARNARLAAIERAVNREGLRFQFLLRLTPINPVTVSYVLGATNTRFTTFSVACLGLIPALFVEVYFGAVASHVARVSGNVSEHSTLHTVLTIAGLAVSVALLVYVTRLARRALSGYENAEPATA